MATTTTTNTSNTTRTTNRKAAGPRVRGSARGANTAPDDREAQYDLLTAALVGVAVGAGTTLLLRRGPTGRRPIEPAWRVARDGARQGARWAERGARAAFKQGARAWDRVPRDEIEERLRDYYESAKETIDDLVESELKDLRRAIRRKRKQLGF